MTSTNALYGRYAAEEISDLVAADLPSGSGAAPSRAEKDTLNVLSLFSGCGGMDIGLEGGFICHRKSVTRPDWVRRAVNGNWVELQPNRFRTVFACDILNEARRTWLRYMERYGVDPGVFHFGSIVDLVKRRRQGESVFPDRVDVVTGGFPCQDFSVAGKRRGFDSSVSHDGGRRADDSPSEETRGKLYMWMKEVIELTRPKMFIAENVKGLVSLGDVKDIIQRDFSSAHAGDYIVLPPQVLHAANYGVPETRERVIFIGIRRSALLPAAAEALSRDTIPAAYNPYPAPSHHFNAGGADLPAPVTCRDVFDGLPEPEASADLSQRSFSGARLTHGQGQTEINLDGLGPTIRSEHHGNIEFRRLSAAHGGAHADELGRGLPERRLTPRECALIQTFPPDYPFVFRQEGSDRYAVSPSGAYKVIGNAVPPVLAYHIGRRMQEVWPLLFG